jgi:arginyl-tRNA synthetase
MITHKLQTAIKQALKTLGIEAEAVVLEHPAELTHGDYSTNVSLAYAKQAGMNPRAFAESIVAELMKDKPSEIETIDIAGPGFINFHLTKEYFAEAISAIPTTRKWGSSDISKGKKVMVEYTDPNPFKPFHIGHLMTNAIGESIARIFEYSGANVIRANYQGDVGLHVAKVMWMLLKKGKCEPSISVEKQAEYIGACYVEGSSAYENDEAAKAEIDAINKKVYDRSDEAINTLYDWGRAVTLEAFEAIYKTLGTKFSPNCYFFESIMAPIGAAVVRQNVGKVFVESDGAIVFKAEEHDPKLHTRVFITKSGLPTYEAKEIGLTMTKFTQENPDLSIVVTAIEQGPYMSVVQKAISLIHPDYAARMLHITHGMMRFASGKMSSRKGNVITGESMLSDAYELVLERMTDREFTDAEKADISHKIGVAAIKYTIIKQQLGSNIIYDEERSVSFDGDSGPYLQYTAVRAQSILEKGTKEGLSPNTALPYGWQSTDLEKYLYRFPEVVERAYLAREPHHIAGYALELSALFNSFYGQGKIVDAADPASSYKLALTHAFRVTIVNALDLLGIDVPDKM